MSIPSYTVAVGTSVAHQIPIYIICGNLDLDTGVMETGACQLSRARR